MKGSSFEVSCLKDTTHNQIDVAFGHSVHDLDGRMKQVFFGCPVALVYFCGHGGSVDGTGYVLGIGHFFEVWGFPATNVGLCVDGPCKTARHLQNTPGTPAMHFPLGASGSQSALYKPLSEERAHINPK